MTKELDIYGVYDTPELPNLPEVKNYNDFRKIGNEHQLEAIKSALAPYIFDEDVIVQGIDLNKDGDKVVALTRFEVMLKATNMFLSAMNMQNKMWGLYTVPAAPHSNTPPPSLNIIGVVQDMQRIAKKLALPPAASEPRPIDNGAPDPDSRGRVTD